VKNMQNAKTAAGELSFHALTAERWDDFVRLFGPPGADGGCWCMWWRTTRASFASNGGEGNKAAMRAIVDRGQVPGILAYRGRQTVGWCSVAPRQDFGALERSPVLRRIDERPVWSIVCFFILKEERGRGIAAALLDAALDYVRAQGGTLVEAYPPAEQADRIPESEGYMGLEAMYEQAGFSIALRPAGRRLIMRRELD